MDNSTPSPSSMKVARRVGRHDEAILRKLERTPDWFDVRVLQRLTGYPDEEHCWLWQGNFCAGLCKIWVPDLHDARKRRSVSVARVVWLAFVGPVGAGLLLARAPGCDVRCVNPAHRTIRNHSEMLEIPNNGNAAAINRRKTHCPRGHELTPDNTYPAPNRERIRDCATCRRESYQLVRAAAAKLGMQVKEYKARHGASRATAERILAGRISNCEK